jgi:hypothetical protein
MTHRSARLIQVVCLAIAADILAGDAHAQGTTIDSAVTHVGLGAGISFYSPSSGEASSSQGIALAYRWHGFHSGWGPTFGLDWHSTDFNQTLGSVSATPLGSLRMRALLAGIGYTRHYGKLSASASVSAGYSFNDFSVDGNAGPAFARGGIPFLGASVDNSAMLKPALAVWYDVARHVGVGVGVAYLVARPEETLTTATGSESRHLNADALEVSAGLTFGVWKKQ